MPKVLIVEAAQEQLEAFCQVVQAGLGLDGLPGGTDGRPAWNPGRAISAGISFGSNQMMPRVDGTRFAKSPPASESKNTPVIFDHGYHGSVA